MKRIYYLQKIEVELGDLIAYKGFKTTVTEELIELNPELFKVEEHTQPMYFKCVNSRMSFTLGRVYEQKDHSEYPERVSLKGDDDVVYNIKDWTSNFIFRNNNCFVLTTKAEWDKQELLDKAKRDYPIGTVFRSLFGKICTVKNKPCYSLGEYNSIIIDGKYVYRDGRWAGVLPLNFTTEDGVSIYGDMRTYLVHPNDNGDIASYHGLWMGDSKVKNYKYFYHKENALAYIEKHKEKTLDDYEDILFEDKGTITFGSRGMYLSVYGWLKDNEPKLYYTKILQLIADDLNDGRYIHIRGNTSYHLSNAHGVNVHCGGDEGCVYFKSEKLAQKAKDILGNKVNYLFN